MLSVNATVLYMYTFLILLHCSMWTETIGANKLITNWLTANRFPLFIRNVQRQDLTNIAELCADTFDGPFDWLRGLKGDRARSVREYKDQLINRFDNLVTGGYKHAMFVACEDGGEGGIVGFLEVGTLPPPVALPAGKLHS